MAGRVLTQPPNEPPEPTKMRRVVACSCGCGWFVNVDDDVHYVDEDGNVFFDLDCVMRYYGIQYVD